MVSLVRLLALTLSLRTRGDHSLALVPSHRLFSHQSWLSVPGNPIIKWPVQVQSLPEVHPPPPPPPTSSFSSFPHQANKEEKQEEEEAQNPTNLFQRDCATICDLLSDHTLSGPTLEAALDQTSIKPCSTLLQTIFHHFDSSPKPLFTVFLWAQKQPSFHCTPPLFNSMIDILAKARLFDLAWSLLLNRLRSTSDTTSSLISADTFAVLIRRYSRAAQMLQLFFVVAFFALPLHTLWSAGTKLESLCGDNGDSSVLIISIFGTCIPGSLPLCLTSGEHGQKDCKVQVNTLD